MKMHLTAGRRQLITEWIATQPVRCKERVPMFQVGNYGSIFDLDVVSESMGIKVWHCESGQEKSLSDHNSILCETKKQTETGKF